MRNRVRWARAAPSPRALGHRVLLIDRPGPEPAARDAALASARAKRARHVKMSDYYSAAAITRRISPIFDVGPL